MDTGLESKVVLVTGATSGIGRAVALKFAVAKARVVAVGRDRLALDDIGTAVRTASGEPLTIAADVTNESEVHRAIADAISKFGRLDVLVNAAGHISTGSIEDTSLDKWDAMMGVNLRAVFHLMQTAVPHLIKAK